jgi:hypothetical protein
MTGMTSSRTTRAVALTAAGLALLLLASACAGAPGPNNVADVDAAHISGFWAGLWHGFIILFTFIASLFTDQVNIYEVHNNGGWYNFGYLLGVMFFFGGGGASSRRRR